MLVNELSPVVRPLPVAPILEVGSLERVFDGPSVREHAAVSNRNVVLQGCRCGVTGVQVWCYRGADVVLQGCRCGVTGV